MHHLDGSKANEVLMGEEDSSGIFPLPLHRVNQRDQKTVSGKKPGVQLKAINIKRNINECALRRMVLRGRPSLNKILDTNNWARSINHGRPIVKNVRHDRNLIFREIPSHKSFPIV